MRYLYVVRSNGFHKIGITNDVAKRVSQMQVGNPSAIEIVSHYVFDNPMPAEREIHALLSDKNETGEWFKIDETDLISIDSVCVEYGGTKMFIPSLFPALEDDEISPDEEVYIPSTGWRLQVVGTGSGEYKSQYSYYGWSRGSGNNREYAKGGKISREDISFLDRPGKGNRSQRKK